MVPHLHKEYIEYRKTPTYPWNIPHLFFVGNMEILSCDLEYRSFLGSGTECSYREKIQHISAVSIPDMEQFEMNEIPGIRNCPTEVPFDITLPETNITSPLKLGRAPKGNPSEPTSLKEIHLPTIHFQGREVSFRESSHFSPLNFPISKSGVNYNPRNSNNPTATVGPKIPNHHFSDVPNVGRFFPSQTLLGHPKWCRIFFHQTYDTNFETVGESHIPR